jgi:GR25 family glycosyltransferase involved in LPS biosynthesis
MQINLLDVPVFYINLNKDKGKRTQIEEALTSAGFTNVKRFPGAEIETSKLGCATSHNSILKKISKINGPVLVLEDDVALSHSFNPIIDVPDNADAVYLGISKFGLYNGTGHHLISAEQHDMEFYRIYNMLSAHAILYLNKDYSRFLIKTTDFMMSIKDNQDKSRAMTMKFFNVYALNDPFFFQQGYNEKHTKFIISRYRKVVGKDKSL